MPRNIQTHTVCAGPGNAKSHYNLTGFLGFIVNLMLDSTKLGQGAIVALFLTILVGLIAAHPVTAILVFALLMAALEDAKTWYFKGRLLCIDDQEPCEECKESGSECKNTCAIGTITDPAHNNFDGDGAFNLMLAPYVQRDHMRALLKHIEMNRTLLQQPGPYNDPPFVLNGGMPIESFHGSVGIPNNFRPDLLDDPAANPTDVEEHRGAIRGFFGGLRGSGFQKPYREIGSNLYNHMLIGYVDRLLASDPSKAFFKHFFRKDASKITPGSATWNAIPQDFDETVPWQAVDGSTFAPRMPNQYWLPGTNFGLNAMFRFNHGLLASYLHCEIDGNRVERMLNIIMVALAAFMVAYLLLLGFVGPAIAAFLAVLLAMLALIIGNAIDNLTGGGMAGLPDVEFEDPDVETGDAQGNGDVVAVYGRWIMDTEHGQYFEIHPVKAYFVMARDGLSNSVQLVDSAAERKERGFERFDNSEVTKAMADEICHLMCKSENGRDEPVILRTAPQALSYGLTTRYGGAGFVAP
jgi:hypothetical protein